MATINLKAINLHDPIISNISQPYEDIYVSKAFSLNSIVITENKNRVYLFQIDDRKIINEWRLNTIHSLSSGAIQHPDKIHFSAIIDHLTLRTWTIHDTTMHHKTNSLKLLKLAHGLIYLENGTLIIIYQDGSLGCATDINFYYKPDNMIKENTFVIKDYNHIIHDGYSLLRVLLVDNIKQSYIIQYKIIESSNFQVSSTIELAKSPLYKNLILNADLHLADNFVSVSLDDQQYLVSGPLPNCDDLKSWIYIWDAGFEIIRSKEAFNVSGILKFLRIENSIIVVTLYGIFEIFLNYEPSSLISCILQKEENQIINCKKNQFLKSNTNLQYIYSTHSNDFSKKLSEWIDLINKLDPCQRILIRPHVDPVVLELSQRSSDSDDCGLDEINLIILILQTGLVTSRCCDNLINLVDKSKDINLLLSIIKCITNLSEANIVDILNILLQISNCDDFKNIESMSHAVLKLILKLPFTRVDMVMCLKELQFGHLLVLLEFLFNSLIINENSDNLNDIDEVNIIDWLSMLLDSHYTKLILYSDCKSFINDIRNYIKQKISETNKRVFADFQEKYISHLRRSKIKQKRRYIIQSFVY